MEEHKDIYCQSCLKGFSENEDIVYCPVCGAPVHRSCWEEKGGCPYEDKHKDGFVYQYPKDNIPDNNTKASSDINVQNDKKSEHNTNSYPNKPLFEDNKEDREQNFSDSSDSSDPDYMPNILKELLDVQNRDNMSDEDLEKEYGEKKFDGVSAKEMACFLNVNDPQKLYRLAFFKLMIASGKKVSFNFFSGILNPYNQLYKGMMPLGILLTLINFVTGFPNIIAYYYTFFKAETEASALIGSTAFLSAAQFLGFIQFALVILMTLFGDYLYSCYMVKKIKKIRSRFSDDNSEEYLTELVYAGRPKPLLVVIGILAQCILAALAVLLLHHFQV